MPSCRTLHADSAVFFAIRKQERQAVRDQNPSAANAEPATGQRQGTMWSETYSRADGAVARGEPLRANTPLSALSETSSLQSGAPERHKDGLRTNRSR
jgi:hypothetical protein